MKQLYFFIVFCLTQILYSVSAEPIIEKPEKILKALLSKHDDRVYLFYEDNFLCIDLITGERRKVNFKSDDLGFESFMTLSSSDANYFLDPLGGGVYLFENDSLYKIDNSYKHKMQIDASIFSYKGSIYKYGGYGFWSHRDFMTRFDKEIREWEFVPFDKSDVFPKGRENAIIKVIEDNVYVMGGYILKDKNPLISSLTYDVWRFNMVNGIWTNLGTIKNQSEQFFDFHRIDFNENIIIDNINDDILMVIDLKNNRVKSYQRTSFTRKIFNQSSTNYNMFFHKEKFYGFLKKDNNLDEMSLVYRNSDEIFGELVSDDKLYEQDINFTAWAGIVLTPLVLIFLGFKFKEQRIKNRKLIFRKGYLYFKNEKIELEPVCLLVLNHILASRAQVYSKDVLEWIDKPHLDYSHKTRLVKDVLYKINYKIKSVLKSDDDPIQVNKSKFDKRLKVYSLDKSLFLNQ